MQTDRRRLTLRASGTKGQAIELRSTASMQCAPDGDNKRPTFTINAYNGGPIRPKSPWLEYPIIIDLSGVSSRDRISAILNHNDRLIVGQTDKVRVGRTSIDMTGSVTGPYETEGHPAWEVVSQAKGGYVWPVSLGASILNLELVAAGQSETVNGQTVQGPIYVARRTNLRHISFLSDGADQTASARIAASAAKENLVEFNTWLTAKGIDPEKLDDQVRETLRSAFDAEQSLAAGAKKKKARTSPAVEEDDDDPPTPRAKKRSPSDSPLAAARAKRDRKIAADELIARAGEEYPDAIEDLDALLAAFESDETLTMRDLDNGILRATSMSQRIDNRQRRGDDSQVADRSHVEAALCMAGGLQERSLIAGFGNDVLNRTRDRWRNGLSLSEFLRMAARTNGWNGDSYRSDSEGILRAAFRRNDEFGGGRTLRASGTSTYDASTILSNVMNKFLVDYFNAVDMSAMNLIAAKRPVNDFKQITSVSMTGDLTYERVAPGGELKHGTFGERVYTNQADTFGKILGISRKDLINDDLGAFRTLANRLGRGGAFALLDYFWTKFLDNSTFFATGNSNYDSGADSALSLDGLTSAKTIFNRQTQPKADGTTGGKPLNATPRILLVPPELEALAKQILNSQLIVMAGTAGTADVRGNVNIHAGTLTLGMARECSNSNYTGYSTTKWYLLADPNDIPTIEICYLNGVERPTVESAQADFNTLGIQMRGYFDFGAELQEFRGGVGMAGA